MTKPFSAGIQNRNALGGADPDLIIHRQYSVYSIVECSSSRIIGKAEHSDMLPIEAAQSFQRSQPHESILALYYTTHIVGRQTLFLPHDHRLI
jgi:hypothetical protein